MQKIQIVKDYIQAAYQGNIPQAASYLSEEIVLHLGGQNQLSGRYQGRALFFETFGKMLALTQNTYRLAAEEDWLESNQRVILIATESAQKEGQTHTFKRAIEYVFAGEVIAEINIYEAHPQIVDLVFA